MFDMVQGGEWILLALTAISFLICLYLVISVQGDLRKPVHARFNSNEQATKMFIDLVKQAQHQIDIHDDGNNFEGSIYNNQEVMDVLSNKISEKGIKVRCLFNDPDQQLKLLELAQTLEAQDNIEIWYLDGGRQEPDTHYKIVDKGRFVHTSRHEHGGIERTFILRKAPGWWEYHTRNRISRPYREHFEHGLKHAVRAV